MSMFVTKSAGIFKPLLVRTVYNRSRIGNRDWVGFGHNGCANYKDDAHFPFPAVRFKENTKDVWALREKEKGDWRCLCCEEKKALYRASFCQTFSEFQHPTGVWKIVIGSIFIGTTFCFWAFIFCHQYVFEPLPDTLCEESKKHQLRRMLDTRVNPVQGISSKWDYDLDRWKDGQQPFQYGGGSVHVWAGISSEGRTELVAIENGNLTGERFAQEILNEYAGPFCKYG